MVGFLVEGRELGEAEGFKEGATLGIDVGFLLDGTYVGINDGVKLVEGATEGVYVGSDEGEEGATVGSFVGGSVKFIL